MENFCLKVLYYSLLLVHIDKYSTHLCSRAIFYIYTSFSLDSNCNFISQSSLLFFATCTDKYFLHLCSRSIFYICIFCSNNSDCNFSLKNCLLFPETRTDNHYPYLHSETIIVRTLSRIIQIATTVLARFLILYRSSIILRSLNR